MTNRSHLLGIQRSERVVLDRAAILAADDRWRASMRLAQAAAERDLARRRRLIHCFASDRATHEARIAAVLASHDAVRCTLERARALLSSAYFRPAA